MESETNKKKPVIKEKKVLVEKATEEKKTETGPNVDEKVKSKNWSCKFKGCFKNKTVIALLVLLVFVGGFLIYNTYYKQTDIGSEAAKAKVEKYINANLLQPGTKATIKNITAEGNLYKVTVLVGTQEVVGYVTKDGKKFFPQSYDMTKTAAQNAASQPAAKEKTEAEKKTEVPTVDLFVMSYCPYGLQMERGVIPVVEALGDKIKYNLKFVSYTLHGQKEVDENVNQYCINKTQPDKLSAYLKCFWTKSTGLNTECMNSSGIDAQQVKTCVSETNKQFSPTEKAMGIDKADNDKYGVQGSPTLVVNGTTLSSGRDSASILKAVCSGFTNQPKECSEKLSATSPASGFDDEAAASASAGGSTTAAGACN